MKKLLIAALLLVGFSAASHAWMYEQSPDRTVRVTYSTSSAVGVLSTTTVLIDLSSTTVWPHKNTREININGIRIEWDKVAATTCTVKLGVVNYVDTSSGSVTWFYTQSSVNNVSNTQIDQTQNYWPYSIRTRVERQGQGLNGKTPYLLSSDVTTLSTVYQSDVNLSNPSGVDNAPGVGDIIMQFDKSSLAAVDLKVQIDYYTPEAQ